MKKNLSFIVSLSLILTVIVLNITFLNVIHYYILPTKMVTSALYTNNEPTQDLNYTLLDVLNAIKNPHNTKDILDFFFWRG